MRCSRSEWAVPLDADEWFDRAMNLAQYGTEYETLQALPHALEVTDPAKRSQLMSMRTGILVALDRADEALALLPERIAALREAGLDAQADLEHRLGLATFGADAPEDVAALDRELADSASLPAWSRGDLAFSRASLHLRADEPDTALDLIERAAREFSEAGDARLVNTTTHLAISALLHKGDLEGAYTLTDRLLAGRPERRAPRPGAGDAGPPARRTR